MRSSKGFWRELRREMLELVQIISLLLMFVGPMFIVIMGAAGVRDHLSNAGWVVAGGFTWLGLDIIGMMVWSAYRKSKGDRE